jgi:hypothetical protein
MAWNEPIGILSALCISGVSGCVTTRDALAESLLLDPLSQITVSSVAAGSECAARIDGDRLVIPRGTGGVSVYDISDPAHPLEIATVDPATLGDQGGASALLPDGRLIVSLPIRQTLAAVDITGPVPVKLGEFGSIAQTLRVAPSRRGLFAYAQASVDYLGGVYAFDASLPLPIERGDYLVDLIDPGFFVRSDDVVFFARTPEAAFSPAHVDALDMGTPTQPVLLGDWPSETPGNVVGIDVSGDRMALAAYWGGIWMLDVEDPANMRLLDHEDFPDMSTYSVDVALMPPFVLLLQGGPSPAQYRLDTLSLRADGTLDWRESMPLASRPMALLHDGSLVVVQTTVVDDFGQPVATELDLYASDVDLFADGFDG